MGAIQPDLDDRNCRGYSRVWPAVLRCDSLQRKTCGKSRKAMTSKAHAIEILAVIVTSVVLGYIGVISAIQLVAVDTPPPNTPTVTVIARQFYWTFVYPNGTSITWPNGTTITYPNGYSSENYLYVKAGQAIQLQVISLDVAHSFFIYQLGIHIDAIPGHINRFWLEVDSPGTFRIECTQFCGTGHYTMVGQLVVTP